MTSPVVTQHVARGSEDKTTKKFGMYCQRLAERPRLMKHVLVGQFHSSDVPSKNNKAMIAALSSESWSERTMYSEKEPCETVELALQEEFMKKFEAMEDAPEEVKFPVLRASHPGGRIFKTQRLGVAPRHKFMSERHPFYLKDPNAPAREYSCYYDKHLSHFFSKNCTRRKLVDQGIITKTDHFIREPYKVFKEYIRRSKLPYGTNPIIPRPQSSTPRRTKHDNEIKEFLGSKYKIKSDLLEEMYSGRRRSSVVPLSKPESNVYLEETRSSPLPALRCSTPNRLASMEKEFQEDLHHSRINVVVAKRDMLSLQKKSRAIEQGMIKERRCGDNKKQIELDRWEKRLENLRSTFDKKKNAIFNRLQEIEAEGEKNEAQKKANTDQLKKKFAAEFIKQQIAERQIKEKRQNAEDSTRIKNEVWLNKHKMEREKESKIFNKKLHEQQVKQLAEITSEKTAKIAQLQIKLEYYNDNLESVKDNNTALQEKVKKLNQQKMEMKPGSLDSLHY